MAIQNSNSALTSVSSKFLPSANSDNMARMRMAAPVVNSFQQLRMAKDTFNGARQMAGGAQMMDSAGQTGRSLVGGIGQKIETGFKGLFGGGLKSFFGALKANFAISALLSGVSNLYEMATGKVKPMQAAGNFVADTAAYTGIGAASTTIGGMIGSLIPIPVVGTLLGVAVGGGIGLLLGKFYETHIRSGFSSKVQTGIQSLSASASHLGQTATTPAAPAAVPAQ